MKTWLTRIALTLPLVMVLACQFDPADPGPAPTPTPAPPDDMPVPAPAPDEPAEPEPMDPAVPEPEPEPIPEPIALEIVMPWPAEWAGLDVVAIDRDGDLDVFRENLEAAVDQSAIPGLRLHWIESDRPLADELWSLGLIPEDSPSVCDAFDYRREAPDLAGLVNTLVIFSSRYHQEGDPVSAHCPATPWSRVTSLLQGPGELGSGWLTAIVNRPAEQWHEIIANYAAQYVTWDPSWIPAIAPVLWLHDGRYGVRVRCDDADFADKLQPGARTCWRLPGDAAGVPWELWAAGILRAEGEVTPRHAA